MPSFISRSRSSRSSRRASVSMSRRISGGSQAGVQREAAQAVLPCRQAAAQARGLAAASEAGTQRKRASIIH